jgi:hypothetical protein
MWKFDVASGISGRACNSYADALRDLAADIENEHDSLIEQAESQEEADSYTADMERAVTEIEAEIATVAPSMFAEAATRTEPEGGQFNVTFSGRDYFIREY